MELLLNIRRILFPADLSPMCSAIVPHVKAMAASFKAEVEVLNVLEAPSGYYKDWNAYLALASWVATRKDRQRRLNSFMKHTFPGKDVRHMIEEGDPARVIANYAQDRGVDLIMMPTHGYGPFRSLLIGSVTAKVLHDVEIPVWTSAHSPDVINSGRRPYKRLLCAVDSTEKSIPVMQWADKCARHFKASLHLVHAVPGADGVDPSFQSFLYSTAKNELEKLQRAAGINVETCVAAGSVGDAVRDLAAEHRADLIVMGRGHLSGTLGRLRTNVYAIIRQAPCSVISV
jgi:nucleotide-binding universal stress UspA family protein